MGDSELLPPGVIVVTGASRGLGRGLVEHLLGLGRPVIAVARRFPEDDGAAAPDPTRLIQVEADLSSTDGIEAALAAIRAGLGSRPLAALVNGAGRITPIGPLAGHSSDDLLAAFTLAAVAPARLSTALADRLVPGGRVLNLSTRSAHATFPGLSLYCLSKHALRSVTRSLQLELPATVGVADLIPGEVDTAMQADLRAPDPADFPLASFFRANEVNLIPTDVAVAFLAWVLLATPLDSFRREQPWYVYDPADQPQWLPEGVAFTYSEP
ncbi:SDR family NAD(P)-dependent oxidoreductase [Vulcanococcus limneticus]|uniref:SDR family NAD(P)-dependent oxidoreductase n=1 Tax=Vulcanococcus limneticus TaxID=2170428 RepID=UPI00398BF18C